MQRNGIAGVGMLFTQGEPHPVLGPSAVGIIGGVGFTLVAGWILFQALPKQKAVEN